MKEKLPNFIIIGAGKSGTTALHNYCNAHPQVFMTDVKETNFFELEGKAIHSDPINDPERLYHYPQSINNWEDYKALFKDVTDEIAYGETSPMYLYGERAPYHIKEKLPNVKLVAILREPIDRLYSRWLHLLRDGNDPIGDFENAMDKSTIWWKRKDLVQEGFYYDHLSRYIETFPKSQLKVFLYDDLKADSAKVMHDLFEFIGVDPTFKPDLKREYNVSGKPKNTFIDSIIGTNSPLIKTAKYIAPSIVDILKSGPAHKALTEVRKKNMERPEISLDFKRQLYTSVYKNQVLKLEELIGRDLSKWKYS